MHCEDRIIRNHITLPVTFSDLRELLGALYYRHDDRFYRPLSVFSNPLIAHSIKIEELIKGEFKTDD